MKIIESPREGMQGMEKIIPASDKLNYLHSLLNIGFDTVEAGSFVSARLIPQMADTAEILGQLDPGNSKSNIMVLVVNKQGVDQAVSYPVISHLSFPFSFSPVFLKHNLNASIDQCLQTLHYLLNACSKSGKIPVIYISMAFGNPYGDAWHIDKLLLWIEKLKSLGVHHLPLSNVSIEISPQLISSVFSAVHREFQGMDIGLHLHTTPYLWKEKVRAAFDEGCRRFDTVIHGYGGCPMAGGEMLGNLDTLNMLYFLEESGIKHTLSKAALLESGVLASKIFGKEVI